MRLVIIMIFLFALLLLVSCTSSDNSELKAAKHDLRFTTEQLQSCQASLSSYRNGGLDSSQSSAQSEPEQPAEPQCEDIVYHIIYQGNKKLDTCIADNVTDSACGIQATRCDSGYAYSCLKDVTYKTVSIKKCE